MGNEAASVDSTRTGKTYRRQALALVFVFLLTAALFAIAGWFVAREHVDISSQALNRDLAERIVAENKLTYAEGAMLDESAIKATFDRYMSLNPAIEIYQLDGQGNIIAFSADTGVVKRQRVSLEPVKALLDNEKALPILGDDPRGTSRRKIFSATRLSDQHPDLGYLYVILRGQAVDLIERSTGDSRFTRWLLIALLVSLGAGLLASLLVFRFLGRPLESLTAQVVSAAPSLKLLPNDRSARDEVETLESTFSAMSDRIQTQMHEIQQQDQRRRQFIADISHDLRTPLTVVNSILESLQIRFGKLDDSDRLDHIATAQQQTAHLTGLVDDLFQLAHLEGTSDDNTREMIQIADLIQDVIHKHALACDQSGLQLRAAVAPTLPLIYGNVALIERMLDNLISNAIAHTPDGGAIDIEANVREDLVHVSVTDSGRGIAREERARIFETGFRGEHSSHSGAGRGLAIAQRIAQWHNGELALSSSDIGTRFEFRMPTSGKLH